MGVPGGFGSTLIGGLASAMLYGITILQAYMYYMHYSEDGSAKKFVVAVLWILDTLHVAFMCHMLYYYLITNYGNPMSLEYIVWSFSATIVVDCFVILIVQFFFLHQIYCLCRHQVRWLVTAPIVILVLAHFGLGMATAIVTLANNTVTFASQTRLYTATPAVSVVALAEVLITVSLCVLLYDGGSRSTVQRTKRLLNTLIIYAVNRCLLTSLAVIAEVVVDAADLVAWTMTLNFIVTKLYTNSLLASLNTRQHVRSQDSGPESNPDMSTVRFANPLKLVGDIASSKDGVQRFDGRDAAVIDIVTEPAFDKTTMLRRD